MLVGIHDDAALIKFIQMFTDFLAECRAHKLQADSQPDIMGAAKAEPILKRESAPLLAATA